MNLVWKLLRHHISIPQFAGFFLANLVGMLIIMLGVQFYNDTQAIYNGEDSFMRSDYLIINKSVGTISGITGKSDTFSQSDIDDVSSQPFVKRLGWFSSSTFHVNASFGIEEFTSFSTDMFFESVPDEFVDVKSESWTFHEGDTDIPIILPRNYLDLYNFGYAQSQHLPQLSEGLLGAISLDISIRGNDQVGQFKGNIAGFSSRLNTILVPEEFMKWTNDKYGTGTSSIVSRLILEVDNPADENITQYLQDNDYETDQSKLDAPKSYGLGLAHKHLPEMKAISGLDVVPVFCPVVAPFYSGMEVTVSLFKKDVTASVESICEAYKNYYPGPVVRFDAPADEGVKSSVLPLLANIALDCGETLHLDPATGDCLSKVGADKWAREYEKGWELA